jgi:hypothetical protein
MIIFLHVVSFDMATRAAREGSNFSRCKKMARRILRRAHRKFANRALIGAAAIPAIR